MNPRLLSRVGLIALLFAIWHSPGSSRVALASRAEMPKIDFHTHYTYARPYLPALLDRWGMQAMVIEVIEVDDDHQRKRWPLMRAHFAQHPHQLMLCTTFDATLIDTPDFAEQVVARLKEDVAQGARMVKVWKEIGMVIKDASGRYIQIDDPRFQPIWDYLSAEGIPVLAHIGEPRAAWLPLDERSPHYSYYQNNPQNHAYQDPEVPRWETIMQARDNWLAANPNLIVIGAHLGSMAYDVDEIARRLERYPNFYVDTAARFGDLALQPSDRVRAFFLKHQDRILYGSDLGTSRPMEELSEEFLELESARIDLRYTLHWRYLSSAKVVNFEDYGMDYAARAEGLNLPPEALNKIYYSNAARVLRLN